MLQNIPYKGTLNELQNEISATIPTSYGVGGTGAGELTIGSVELLSNVIKMVNELRQNDKAEQSLTFQNRRKEIIPDDNEDDPKR